MGLAPLLGLISDQSFRVISIVGGGGKSTFILKISNHLKNLHINSIVTTTTKMWLWQVLEMGPVYELKELCRLWQRKKGPLEEHFSVVGSLVGEKVTGIGPEEVEKLRGSFPQHKILVESDGAKGMSLKAHALHEPVVPPVTELLVGVIGLDCLYKKVKEVVFRVEEFVGLHNITKDAIVDLRLLENHINHPIGLFKGAPKGCIKMVLFNKLDLFDSRDRIILTKELLELNLKAHYVVITSMKEEEVLLKENAQTP